MAHEPRGGRASVAWGSDQEAKAADRGYVDGEQRRYLCASVAHGVVGGLRSVEGSSCDQRRGRPSVVEATTFFILEQFTTVLYFFNKNNLVVLSMYY